MNPLYNGIRYNSKIRYNVNPSCTKNDGSCISSLTVPVYSLGKHTFWIFLESPRKGDSYKYTKRMIYKRTVKNIRYSCFRRVHIKCLYNSKFDFIAKSLVHVTNTAVIKRVICKYVLYRVHAIEFGRKLLGL